MNRSNVTIAAIVAVILLILCCVCLLVVLGLGYFLYPSQLPAWIFGPVEKTATPVVIRPTVSVLPATEEDDPTVDPPATQPFPSVAEGPGTTPAVPAITTTAVPGGPVDTLQTLQQATIPPRDLFALNTRLKGEKQEISPTLPPPAAPFEVGARQNFWVLNGDTNENFQVQATLHYVTPHSYFWVEDGVDYDADALRRLAETFESKIYPTDRAFFGSEWTPGVDGDPHLYILYARGLGTGTAGYFSSLDSYPPALIEYSNGHEMFIFNADSVDFAEEYAYGVLAHEFQHMIHWYQDLDEIRWLNEGLSDLAMQLNGYSIGGHDYLYALNPDLQLNDWPSPESLSGPNYGAAYLFTTYFLDRFGEGLTQNLVGDPKNDLNSIDDVLKQAGITDSQTGQLIGADDFFTDWAITNYINDGSVGDGRFDYHNYTTPPPFKPTETISRCPVENQVRDVHQYGVDYIRLRCRGKYTLSFEGSIQVPVVPTDPHSGDYVFWSNKGDEGDMTLTHTFDFSNQTGPLTFTYWTWYDLEKDYDYLYLLASTDGENWQMLQTPSGTDADPTGANYGWGYNAISGNGGQPEWIQEQVDLSQFAGQKLQLRFEYITDAGVNGEGFLLDDVTIPEIGYASDFETDNGGWEAAGFVRIENVLPQTFELALITRGVDTRVQYIPLSPDVSAQATIDIGDGVNEAILVVSGTSRYTRQMAAYRFSIRP